MGANATTFVPTYVAGQVLEAADLNVTNSGVPVFADATARDAAFGGSGEKVLAEGQLAYLEDSNIVQYYDGSSWATVGPIVAPAAGLTLISATTIGSAVSDVTVNNAFSSTYDNYRIVVMGGTSTALNTLSAQLGATTTGYYYSTFGQTYAGAASNFSGANITAWAVGLHTTTNIVAAFDLLGPNLAKQTIYNGFFVTDTTTGNARVSAGYLADTTQYTSIKFIAQSPATLTGGVIRIYGYLNS